MLDTVIDPATAHITIEQRRDDRFDMTDTNPRRATIETWWTELESDWQAVLLGLGLLFAVYLGVRVPW